MHACGTRRKKTYVGQTLASVEAEGFKTTVAQHLYDLGILLTVLLEGEFSTLVVVFLGTATAVLAAL